MNDSVIPLNKENGLLTWQSIVPPKYVNRNEEPYGFLCFTLGDEEYGIDLNVVAQVVKPPPLAWVPRVEPYILGIVSIRGAVVTLVDLRHFMGLTPTEWPKMGRVLIVEIDDEQIGMLVDSVTQVRRVLPSDLEKRPALGDGRNAEHIVCVYRPERDHPVLIIDLDVVLGDRLK